MDDMDSAMEDMGRALDDMGRALADVQFEMDKKEPEVSATYDNPGSPKCRENKTFLNNLMTMYNLQIHSCQPILSPHEYRHMVNVDSKGNMSFEQNTSHNYLLIVLKAIHTMCMMMTSLSSLRTDGSLRLLFADPYQISWTIQIYIYSRNVCDPKGASIIRESGRRFSVDIIMLKILVSKALEKTGIPADVIKSVKKYLIKAITSRW
jgi:hypothetical protein